MPAQNQYKDQPQTTRQRLWPKRLVWSLLLLLLLLNVLSFLHAYKLTHFADNQTPKTSLSTDLFWAEKLKLLITGTGKPRPENSRKPNTYFEVVELKGNEKMVCWHLKDTASQLQRKGVVVLCHGYGGEKSGMLNKAEILDSLGFDTFLIDFRGSGGSEGNTTSLGYYEAEQVKRAYDYLAQTGEPNIYLFGTSMGAVAVMKALNDYALKPKAIVLECPYGSLYEAVSLRLSNMQAPVFPFAILLTFWGGLQQGFWAFDLSPRLYAKQITSPILLLFGEQDTKVSKRETQDIFQNLNSKKQLKVYPKAGHESYLIKYKNEWTHDVNNFLSGL